MNPPARQLPDQKAVHRTKRQLAPRRPRRQIALLQYPLQLGPAEIRVEQQPRPRRHHRLMPRRLQRLTQRRRPSVLPDNRPVNRLSGFAVPDHHRLALIGDADPRNVTCRNPRLGQSPRHCRHDRRPQIRRVMLHPARLRIVLREFLLRCRHRTQRPIKHDGAGRSGALINGQQIGHVVLPFFAKVADAAPELKPPESPLPTDLGRQNPRRASVWNEDGMKMK